MKKERLKLVSAMLLLSGFSTGYVQAAPHAAAVEMHSVQQDNACTGVKPSSVRLLLSKGQRTEQ